MSTVKTEPDDGPAFVDAAVPFLHGEPMPPHPMDRPPIASEPERREASTSFLQRLMSVESTEVLEKGMELGAQALATVKEPLEHAASLDPSSTPHEWIKAIETLKNSVQPTRVIVGVVGNTGAGKSSVISAVLDEERLLPTNCMRACTASPTEISYNYSSDPNELYHAEVQFLTADDWVKELEALYADLLDGSGEVSRDSSNQDTEAGIAYAKIKAVYPRKTKEQMSQSNPRVLANETIVRSVLGTSKKLRATTAASIYNQLQTYVDSKEKNTEKHMEYWPLIKVVRIYTKAKALSTGVCLVDLPGVQDSNAARAAVAANYMKSCTGLWIVAPITRAVDDKTAKSLLGDSFRYDTDTAVLLAQLANSSRFNPLPSRLGEIANLNARRQLKYDGTYSAVTFICSKTDDISVTEAAESLGIEDQVSDSWSEILKMEKNVKILRTETADLKDQKSTYTELLDHVDESRDQWEELSNKLSAGEVVYAPSANKASGGKKRKRQSLPKGSRKDLVSSDSDDDGFDSDVSNYSEKENDVPLSNEFRQPLTEDEIDEKLAALKAEKKTFRENRKGVETRLSNIRQEIGKITKAKEALEAEVKTVCIKGRNAYSRGAIKQDFAMGIKELDQETAAEADAANFDPEVDLRDYAAVAESLPVFCVSSRAFQKLSGRLQRDGFRNDGFQSADDTEIPQLQDHAQKLTESARGAASRKFLHGLVHLLNSIRMWASNNETSSGQSDGDKKAQQARLTGQLQKLKQELTETVSECVSAVKEVLADDIFDTFDSSIPLAVDAAVPTAMGWGARRDEGGLLWATYKATTRRYGVYTGASGPRDFNAELFEPISRQLASHWEKAFQRRLPLILKSCAETMKKLVSKLHRDVVQGAQQRGVSYARISMLEQQVQTNIHFIDVTPEATLSMVQELQRTANRNFTPVIQEKMHHAYEASNNERGPGSYLRMKTAVRDHAESTSGTMFRDATNAVRQELDQMCKNLRKVLEEHTEELFSRLSRDYLTALVGLDLHKTTESGTSRAERLLRAEMKMVLDEVDLQFMDLVPDWLPIASRHEHDQHDDQNSLGEVPEDDDFPLAPSTRYDEFPNPFESDDESGAQGPSRLAATLKSEPTS